MSKQQQAWNYLLEGKTLTPQLAIKLWAYYRLADGVHRLRKKGCNVSVTLVGDVKHALYYVSTAERARYKSRFDAITKQKKLAT